MAKSDFKYQVWQKNLLTQFDNIIEKNQEIAQKGLSNIEMIRKEIFYIDSVKLKEILDYSLANNPVKEWSKIYFIHHYFEGEVNITLSSIIFIAKSGKITGFTYSHNLNKYYQIKSETTIKKAIRTKSGIEACNNGIFIVSKFDTNYINTDNKIVIGMCNSSLQPLLKIYDKDAFD
ncbi:MAG: hypothetical protein KIS77_05855 [Saprospiraceae bacterium]|nr:hypothetical protein [Saprospiraceae bacterium]